MRDETAADGAYAEARRLADLFRAAAAGRREYLAACPDERHRELLNLECATLDAVADVIDGNLWPLYSWLPSARWTDQMVAALHDPTGPATGQPPTPPPSTPDTPTPPRDWLDQHTAPSKGSAGNGWQVGWRAGYLSGLHAAAAPSEPAGSLPPAPTAATGLASAVAAIDWARLNGLLAYALTHGGNLPPDALRETDRG